MSQPVSTPEKPSLPSHRAGFRLLAALLGVLPLLCIELGLRLAGVRPTGHDPFAEFGGNVPVFVRDGDSWSTNPAREPYLAQQSFPAIKSERTRRIFCFGGSTVHGRPFQPATAFPAWLELELDQRDPDHDWEVINCGGISYASYRIVPMIREAVTLAPDLIIVATGHNEFLEDRTYTTAKQRSPLLRAVDQLHLIRIARQWLQPTPTSQQHEIELKTRLDETSGYASYHRNPEWRQRVEQQFADGLNEIAQACSAADVPLVFVKLGSNLRDCPPYKSEHRSNLSPEQERDWQAAFEEATQLSSSASEPALAAYRRALAIDDQFALLHYRIARLLDRLGSTNAAAHYLAARDLDICPLRMTGALEALLATVAAAHRVPVVDVSGPLNPPAGFDRYLDHVHPTIGGHQQIAERLIEGLAVDGVLPPLGTLSAAERVVSRTRYFTRLGPRYLVNGQRRLEWLENWARREKLADEIEPVTAAEHFRLAVRKLDFGDFDGATRSFRKTVETFSGVMREQIAGHADAIEAQGRPREAFQLREWLAAL